MKKCPECGQTYNDDGLNFCLADGARLEFVGQTFSHQSKAYDDAPPTLIAGQARVTNPSAFEYPYPPASGPMTQASYQPPQVMMAASPNQTLPIISLVLGIASLVLVCCHGGFLLGIPAIITGFIGMKNEERDPVRYGGKALAIGGMILGVVSLISSIFLLIFGILGQFIH
ncbi:MAG TPA: DUF4190 domain-containing protein [Pyrinomonadaceae bacterium]|nr:DUF4190 domain-containing protein [Pyrinomonadaceae bacterium]